MPAKKQIKEHGICTDCIFLILTNFGIAGYNAQYHCTKKVKHKNMYKKSCEHHKNVE